MSFKEMAFNSGGKDQHTVFKMRTQMQKNVRNIETTSRTQQSSAPPAPILVQPKSAITGGFEFSFSPVGGSFVAGYKVYKSLVPDSKTGTEISFITQPAPGQRALTHQHITAGDFFFWVASVSHDGKIGTKVPMSGAPEPKPSSAGTGSGVTTGGNTSAGSGIGSGGGAAGRVRNSRNES